MNTEGIVHVKNIEIKGSDFVEDGLVYCGQCGEAKQYRLPIFGREQLVTCMCRCESEAFLKAQKNQEGRDRMDAVQCLRSVAIQFPGYRDWNFAADDGKNPEKMAMAHRYVDGWDDIYGENCGLLLWGDVGTGKTYFASCIANALTERMEPVMMTNFTRMSEAMGFDGVNEYMVEMRRFRLLIIDDLGAERQSDYMLERVYSIIDARYKDRQPVIITTNLTLQEIKNPKELKYKRIYDRILEMCVPVRFTGMSRRWEKHEEKKNTIRCLFQEAGE